MAYSVAESLLMSSNRRTQVKVKNLNQSLKNITDRLYQHEEELLMGVCSISFWRGRVTESLVCGRQKYYFWLRIALLCCYGEELLVRLLQLSLYSKRFATTYFIYALVVRGVAGCAALYLHQTLRLFMSQSSIGAWHDINVAFRLQ